MTASSEFPRAVWLGPPKSYTNGRKSGQPRVIVIHTTEGSEGPTAAEDGAAYDKRRTDGTSTHFFVDNNSIVQCVYTNDEAHAARQHGNDIGVQIEICGKAGQSSLQWHDNVSAATLRNAALICADIIRKYGESRIPVRHMTVAQVKSSWSGGTGGFCGHVDITNAFPEDNGTHTDPGSSFPWSEFLDMVREELEDMPSLEEIVNGVWGKPLDNPYTEGADTTTAGGYLRYAPSKSGIKAAVAEQVDPQFAQQQEQIENLTGKVDVLTQNLQALTDMISGHISGILEVENPPS